MDELNPRIQELLESEFRFDKAQKLGRIPAEDLAMAYTCMAHDYYMYLDLKEGRRLLQKAADACPNYFEEIVPKQTKGDSDFSNLIANITPEIEKFQKDN